MPLSQEGKVLEATEENPYFVMHKSLVTMYQIWHSWATVTLRFFFSIKNVLFLIILFFFNFTFNFGLFFLIISIGSDRL